MTIEAGPDGGVSFTVDSVATKSREYQPILDRRRESRGHDHVLFCSWCNRLRAGVGWHEVETAVPMLGIFDDADLPRLEYVMCDTCYTARTGV
jgi:hypothetical protein